MNGLRFSVAVFDAANKVRSCLWQPIFNDCMASMRRTVGKGGGNERREERERERGEAAGCARDENRGAGFRAENEMELNDS